MRYHQFLNADHIFLTKFLLINIYKEKLTILYFVFLKCEEFIVSPKNKLEKICLFFIRYIISFWTLIIIDYKKHFFLLIFMKLISLYKRIQFALFLFALYTFSILISISNAAENRWETNEGSADLGHSPRALVDSSNPTKNAVTVIYGYLRSEQVGWSCT